MELLVEVIENLGSSCHIGKWQWPMASQIRTDRDADWDLTVVSTIWLEIKDRINEEIE